MSHAVLMSNTNNQMQAEIKHAAKNNKQQ